MSNEPYYPVTLHRFRGGAFESTEILSWNPVSFFCTGDNRILVSYASTVAHLVDLRQMFFCDEITTEPVISTIGMRDGSAYGIYYNHLTGNQFDEGILQEGLLDDIRWSSESRKIMFEEMLGLPITRIMPMEAIKQQLIELISERLRANGLVR